MAVLCEPGTLTHTHTHTHTHSHTSKHTQTYSLSPTGARCLCCVINQSCQIDFTAPSEKEERQPPNNLEKMEESKSRGVLLLLKLIPGPKESIKNDDQWGQSAVGNQQEICRKEEDAKTLVC